jgi:hypothetical protein
MIRDDAIPENVLKEIIDAIKSVGPYGSIEIYVQNNIITQITKRNIKKMTNGLSHNHEQKELNSI